MLHWSWTDSRTVRRVKALNGEPAAIVEIYRIGMKRHRNCCCRQSVRDSECKMSCHPCFLQTWGDRSEPSRTVKTCWCEMPSWGSSLVLLSLGLFLNRKLAWATSAFRFRFSSLLTSPHPDVSINMISLFAFIVTLGIVVDDAIIIGEGIYTKRQQGLGPIDAAVQGAKELGTPVVFAILTNMIAFAPPFVPGASGKFFSESYLLVVIVVHFIAGGVSLILPPTRPYRRLRSTR